MKNFQNLIPVAAVLISLSPLAAFAAGERSAAHPTISHSWNTESRMEAVNSKGRPGEFAPASAQQAAYTQYSFSSAPSPNANGAPIQNGD